MRVVFAPDFGDNDYQYLLKLDLKKLNIETFSAFNKLLFPLIRSCIKYRANVLHLHWIGTYIFSSSILLSSLKAIHFIFELIFLRFAGVKIVWTVHNLINHERYQEKFEIFVNKIVIYISNAIIVHCDAQKEKFIEFYGQKFKQKIFVAPEGGYACLYGSKVTYNQAREILKVSGQEKVFLFYGNIRPYKGVDVLIDAFLLNPAGKFLIIAGRCDEETERKIKSRLNGHRNFLFHGGYVSREKTSLYWASADFIVLPYIEIFNSGLVSFSISMGKPVIYSNLPTLEAELSGCGISFEAKDRISLSKALNMACLIDDKIYKDKISQRAKFYSWQTHAKILKSVYERNY